MSTEPPSDLVLVGRVVRPHGLQGEVVVDPVTDQPEVRFAPGSVLLRGDGGDLTVSRYRATAKAPLVAFEEVRGREAAEELAGVALYIDAVDRRPLGPDEFWPEDLIGIRVVASDGSQLGFVSDVEIGVGQDRLLVDMDGLTVIVPFVVEIVVDVDLGGRTMVVDLPPGLID